ncbi:hypothetical protein VDT1_3179 [Vibrio sp. 16]|nr:hypothetical protein VDT1_3179 [Vibrio sp. 16]
MVFFIPSLGFVFKVVWFRFGGLRFSHLNAALGGGQKSSLFSFSEVSLSIRFSKSAIQDCRLKFLNPPAVKHANVPGLSYWFLESVSGEFHWLKRGEGKSTEVFEFAISLQLWVSRVQNLLCC